MVDYEAISKELYEKFHDAYQKLYVSELKDENERLRERLEISPDHPYDGIYCRDETIRLLDAKIDDKQAEIEGLKIIIKDLERRLDHAEWLVDKYRQDE